MVIQNLQFHKEKNLKKVKGSSIAFKIPEDWRISKLKEVAKVDSGNTAPQKEEHFIEGKYPFIRMQHLNVLKENKFVKHFDLINEKAVREKKLKLFKKGSILLPKSGESIRTEKKAMLEFDSYVVNHLAVVEVEDTEKLDNEYLFYYFRHFKLSSLIMQTTTPSINLSTIREIEIPLPPLHEQRKIAHVLTTIDKAIEEVDKAIKKAERIKKGLMQELLTKGIGHKKFKETEIGKIPKEWEVVKLGDILILKNGERPKLSEKGSFFVYGANGIMGLSNNYIVDSDYTIIIGRVGASGEVHLGGGKIWVSDNAIYSESYNKSNTYLPFIFYLLKFKNLKSFAIKTTHPIITQSFLKSFKIPLPPLEEQKKIAEILSKWDRVIELKKAKKEKLERMKKKVMELLLTGKVRVK